MIIWHGHVYPESDATLRNRVDAIHMVGRQGELGQFVDLCRDRSRPSGLHDEAFSNLCSIPWVGGDLARPGPGPADRGAVGAVREAARRRLGHHL